MFLGRKSKFFQVLLQQQPQQQVLSTYLYPKLEFSFSSIGSDSTHKQNLKSSFKKQVRKWLISSLGSPSTKKLRELCDPKTPEGKQVSCIVIRETED